MFRDAAGPLFKWLAPQRATDDLGRGTPVQHAQACGYLGENLLAVHANYVDADDMAILANQGVHVVHCPRSRAYFGHDRFPFEKLVSAGVNICLGTDSLASVRKSRNQQIRLSMFEEMRTFAKFYPNVSPESILRMATVNGAKALNKSSILGEITPGAKADLVTISFAGLEREALEALVHFAGDVSASMINGQWAVEPKE